MAKHTSVAQFAADINARKSANLYVASIKADGNIQVSKNGSVLHPTVVWAQTGSANTDVNPTGEQVLIFNSDGLPAKADAQQYLNSLK